MNKITTSHELEKRVYEFLENMKDEFQVIINKQMIVTLNDINGPRGASKPIPFDQKDQQINLEKRFKRIDSKIEEFLEKFKKERLEIIESLTL